MANKYEWHDLNKNPEDLPKPGRYLVHNKNGKYMMTAFYRCGKEQGFVGTSHHMIDAWKEIEPFNGDEVGEF